MTAAPAGRVLIVDDDPAVRSAHGRFVRALGYDVETAADGIEALTKLALGIDLVLLDIQMPGMDGFEVARRIRTTPQHALLPIVMVTGMDREAWYPRALEVGANDVIAKPINADELRLRTRWLMQLKSANDQLAARNAQLTGSVDRRTEELRAALEEMSDARRRVYQAHLDTIRRLTIAAEYKDEETAGHIARVGPCCEILARAAGRSPHESELIRHAAPMHDIGKIGIPDQVLLKRGELDDVERTLMREHTRIGAALLAGSDSDVMQAGAKVALYHHEHWDGSGYPEGLAGEAIPVEARICSIIDYFDSSTMDRPFRRALPEAEVLQRMRDLSALRFDPVLLDAFFSSLPAIREVRRAHSAQV